MVLLIKKKKNQIHPPPHFPARTHAALTHAQVDSVKQAAEHVAQLRRVGQGLGVYEFDKKLGAA